VLIAGNGEPSLRVYDWQSGQEHARCDLLEHLRDDIKNSLVGERTTEKLAISGIWPVSSADAQNEESAKHILLVALEAMPLLFTFQLSGFGLRHLQTLRLDSNVLDVLHLREQNVVVVSVDTVHFPGSYNNYRSEPVPATNAFQFFGVKYGEILSHALPIQGVCLKLSSDVELAIEPTSRDPLAEPRNGKDTQASAKYEKTYSPLGEVIYGLENLRKRRGKAAEEEDDAADEADGELEGAPDI